MCGICAVFGLDNPAASRTKVLALSKRLRHRGPDWSGCYVGKEAILAHERLAIVGVGMWRSWLVVTQADSKPDTGAQPLLSVDGKQVLAVNGEIYNHLALKRDLGPETKFKTHSDCEVILPLVSQSMLTAYMRIY